MPTDRPLPRALRAGLAGVVASLILVGCAGPGTPDAEPASTSGDSPTSTGATTPSRPGGGSSTGDTGKDPSETPAPGASPQASPQASATPSAGSTSGLELPEAPPETVVSLSELVEPPRTAPLVTAPLPRAADALGRLVSQFPTFLRPTRASRVETSSVSPSGPRLQVALVGSTSLAPEDVLMTYRARLAGRGLAEQAAPAATAGSQAAAFRRGRSIVTLTVTPEGTRTTYSVHATLHTGGE